jgi:hypothetical protein
MLKLPAALVLTVAMLHAQAFRDLLLPDAHHMKGIVVDSEGRPIADVTLKRLQNNPQVG